MGAINRELHFDRLARPYRWLEYASFGRALERCRLYFLPQLMQARRAIVYGDGDGRFLEKLLMANPDLRADVVDISATMLRLLQERLTPEARERVTVHHADARGFLPPENNYDLVITHFFLDCLTTAEIDALVDRLIPRLAQEALWVDSEFAIPKGQLASRLGKAVISLLYLAFGWITALQVRTLPDYGSSMQRAGWILAESKPWLRGLLVSQIWQSSIQPQRQPLTG